VRKKWIYPFLKPSLDVEALGFVAAQCLGWVSSGESELLSDIFFFFFPYTLFSPVQQNKLASNVGIFSR